MTLLIICHKVESFSRWHSVYPTLDEAKAKAKFESERLLRALKDINQIVLIFDVVDDEAANQFAEIYIEKMRASGQIVDEPVTYLVATSDKPAF